MNSMIQESTTHPTFASQTSQSAPLSDFWVTRIYFRNIGFKHGGTAESWVLL